MPAELLPAPEPARPRFRPGARSRSAGRVPHAASPRSFRRMPHAFSAAGADPQNVFRPPLFALPEGAPEAPEGACFARAPPSGLQRAVRMPDGAPRRGHDATPLPSRKIPRMSGGRLRDEPVCTNLFRTPPSDDSGRSPLRTDKAPSPSAPPVRRLDGNLRARRGPSPPLGCRSSDRPQARAGAYSAGHPSKFARTGGDSGIFVLSLHSVSTQTRG